MSMIWRRINLSNPTIFTGVDSSAVSVSPMGEFYAIASAATDNSYGVILQLNF